MNNDQLTSSEKLRIQELMKLVPQGRSTVLDIGARDGYISRLLAAHFKTVTALDLIKPQVVHPSVIPVTGNVADLIFPDNFFDTVFCTEVLEHLPSESVKKACSEIARVARKDVIIGVPYKQDIRVGKTTCGKCNRINPPWGHLNTFDEKKLRTLFNMLAPVSTTYAGSSKSRTNALSSHLMNMAGNPWGTYDQKEPCVFCRSKLARPVNNKLIRKICSRLASHLTKMQHLFANEKPVWMYMVFIKNKLEIYH